MAVCACEQVHDRRKIVLTGGPGAGKTAVLELVRQSFCPHVRVLPEAASIIFGGGFPREQDSACLRAAQRAIFYVERELENAGEAHNPAILLCDRGTIDGLAYWPGPRADFWSSLGTTLERELAKYHAVIELRTPPLEQGYDRSNPVRTESAAAAAEIDRRILEVWERHPRRFVVGAEVNFMDKVARALEILRGELPECCAQHTVPAVGRPTTEPPV